jgi:hypothetical protein
MISPVTQCPGSERLPDESPRAYRAFCHYRDLGPNRSLDRAWERYRTTSDQGKKRKSARRPGHWGAWSQKFLWVKRADAHDDQIDEERRNAAFERRRALREQRSRFEAEQQPQIENLVRMIDSQLERMGSAHQHEVTQVKTDEATGKKIITKIKGFNATGMAVLVKARNQTVKQATESVRDHAAPVGVHRGLLLGLTLPVASWLLRNRNVAPQAHLAHGRQACATVIALVGHDFAHALFMNFVLALGGRRGDLFGHRKPGRR